jgi:hypothetical protein
MTCDFDSLVVAHLVVAERNDGDGRPGARENCRSAAGASAMAKLAGRIVVVP